MSNLTMEMIKELRERTGVGMAKCKEALVESDGDLDRAIEYLRKKGMASAVKKEGRETKEGSIAFADIGSHISLVEVCAETDFVVKNEKFQQFLQSIATQAATTNPSSLQELLEQPTLEDKALTVDAYRNTVIQALGENIQIKRMEVILKNEAASYGIYSHMNGKIVAVVEIEGSNFEQDLAKDIAMHIAAEDPDYLSSEEIPAEIKQREEEIARAQIQGKPADIAEKIVAGKFKAYCDQVCLLGQKFVKDPSVTVEKHVANQSQKVGKTLKLTKFWRWTIS
ncbi:MAG: elongation factor Ts [Chlamydiae bacterium CG10_big_fil_rev_8_21_14_0_10_35_9]|nr:MAG: elongation factor Ts [Chlamydiae bacterium CG10_big_fil_rev_8_21_14_0_10_35_9]